MDQVVALLFILCLLPLRSTNEPILVSAGFSLNVRRPRSDGDSSALGACNGWRNGWLQVSNEEAQTLAERYKVDRFTNSTSPTRPARHIVFVVMYSTFCCLTVCSTKWQRRTRRLWFTFDFCVMPSVAALYVSARLAIYLAAH